MSALTGGAHHRKAYASDWHPCLIASDISCDSVDHFSLLFAERAIPRSILVPEHESSFVGYTPQSLNRSVVDAISRPRLNWVKE
jgi:hypothetical protein